jgi:uncharacterized protein YjiS (DUF1127 family)
MEKLIDRIRESARKRAEYRRTVAELSRIDIDTALDLDIYRGDIPRIAREAVYGH